MNLWIDIELPRRVAQACVKSITQETDLSYRSKVKISETDRGIRINISAEDLSSLRAALNTYLRWVIISSEILMD